MAEVYRARDSTLNRDAAIKVLLPAVAFDTKYAPASLVVVEQWLEELKHLLPAK